MNRKKSQLWFESLSHADQESDTEPTVSASFSTVQKLETLNSLNWHPFLYIFTGLPQRSCDLSAQAGHTLNLSHYRLLQVTFSNNIVSNSKQTNGNCYYYTANVADPAFV